MQSEPEMGDGTAGRGFQVRSAMLISAAALMLGAACWHLAGFWDFVSTATVKGPPIARLELCTTLALDRGRGETIETPCLKSEPLPLVNAPVARRGDFARVASGRPPAVAEWQRGADQGTSTTETVAPR